MMMPIRIGLGTALALLAGCAAGDRAPHQAADDWALASASPIGAPVECIERSRIRGTSGRDDRTIARKSLHGNDFSFSDPVGSKRNSS